MRLGGNLEPLGNNARATLLDKWHGIFSMPSRTDTAGTDVNRRDCQTGHDWTAHMRLDIPRPLITQSHRHGWTYQGL